MERAIDGLPIAVQLVGRRWRDADVLSAARVLE
jgi:Asp-tRNA(Asn)/Glu-tRNA(Gln) amidotransferase A subunit family amidase